METTTMMRNIKRRIFAPPIQAVSIEPTNDCNSDCVYCHRKMRPVGYMDFKHFRGLIDEVPEGMPVTLSYGGESITHPRFGEMARYAQERGHKVVVYSNGIQPYPESVEVVTYAKPPPIILTWNQRFEKPNTLKPIYTFCAELYYGINILWNGDVVPCCHCVSGNRVVGNVFKDGGLEAVWHSLNYWRLRIRGHCGDCEIYPYDLSAESIESYQRKTQPDYHIGGVVK